jgi:4-amino-4-deoxy-L-arabinose transferase-like glycosyltransferase
MTEPTDSAPSGRNVRILPDRTALFWNILIAITLWKLFAGSNLGLIFDECYYWEWSLHPQACYFDHPPLTAWLINAAHALLGHSALTVRIWAILSGILLALAGRELGKDLFGVAAGNRVGILLLLAPIFAGNALLMTPDTFLIPAWAFAILFAWRGYSRKAGIEWSWWIASGAAAGLGMLTKYTMVLFYGGLALLWLLSPRKRARLAAGMTLAALVSLLLFAPVIWWNSQHAWVSFAHQLNHGFRNEHHSLINFQNLVDYSTFLIVLVSPALGLLCFRTAATKMRDPRFRFLGIFFWVVVVFFAFSAAKAHIEANWPMAAFVTGLIMVAGDWESYGPIWRKLAIILLLIADIGAVIGVSYLSLPRDSSLAIRHIKPDLAWIQGFPVANQLRASALQGINDFQCRIEEFLGPQAVAETIAKNFHASGADFLCLSTYQLTGVMSFYAPDLESRLWLPDHGRVRFPWINDATWAGKSALVAEWPRRGPLYFNLFRELPVAHPVEVTGIATPVYLSIGHDYDPKQVENR